MTIEEELASLRRWKAEALAVEATWDIQAIARLLNLPLGVNIRAAIQPAIEKLIAERDAALANAQDDRTLGEMVEQGDMTGIAKRMPAARDLLGTRDNDGVNWHLIELFADGKVTK